ncbi:MAG: phasin family protein, partial [Dehalococcoidia bacterium]
MELALGLSEASRKKAMKVVKKLGKSSGATVEQLQALAEDLTETSAANRDAMVKLIRYEIDRGLGAVGLATVEEVTELTERIRDLEGKLAAAESRAASAE